MNGFATPGTFVRGIEVLRYPSESRSALEFGLERVCRELEALGAKGEKTHLIFECRGAKEDQDLELAFRRVAAQSQHCGRHSIDIIMCPKTSNAAGPPIADLMARPIGRHVMEPTQPNRAYDLICPKFRRGGLGHIYDGYGLKVFP